MEEDEKEEEEGVVEVVVDRGVLGFGEKCQEELGF